MTYLYVLKSADFVFLQNETSLTGGNISSHMAKLEEAGYIQIKKSFVGKRPRTLFRLTAKGRREFEKYRKSLQSALSFLPD